MTKPTTTKNNMLDGQAITKASLHTGFPGTTGANEVTGGSPAYAQKTITMNAGSGGSRLLNAGVTFDVPACTVKWIGFWNSATFAYAAPNGGAAPKNFMAVPSSDLVWSTGHGFVDTQKVVFFDGTPPAPLVEGTTYFVRDSLTDNFKVAATAGGTAIDLTTASSAGCWMCAITEDLFSGQDTHSLTSTTDTIPD